MPNYIEYQQSISRELISIKDRVRNFIDNHHWGEDGRYKEIILSHVLRQHLPKGVSVGTGFVHTEVIGRSGDRGVDVIATNIYGEYELSQCKRYRQGNKYWLHPYSACS